MEFPGFINGSNASKSRIVDAERTVNLYPEKVDAGTGKSSLVLYGTPGLKPFVKLPEAPVRAQLEINGRLFVVTATQVFEVYASGGYAPLGSIAPGPTVSMASNGVLGNQILIATAGLGYILNLANSPPTLAPVNSSGFVGASLVEYLDTYFIALDPNSQEFCLSNANDGTTWQPLNYALAQGGPDNIVSMIVNQRELWLLGKYRTEVYYDSGAANFPLSRNNNVFIEAGCAAAFSVAKLNNSIAWLGQDKTGWGVVYWMNGYTPQRISTHAVEQAIQSYSRIDDATAYSYQRDGHLFYRLDFPTADATWVFDMTEGLWHELGYWDAVAGKYHAHLGRTHSFAFGKHLVGDYKSGNLYLLDPGTYTDNGAPIRRMRTAPHLATEERAIFYAEFKLDMQVGVGLDGNATPGAQANVTLQYSNDGGQTWGGERVVSAGGLGQYKTRVIWRRLGRARDRVFSVIITDPVFVALINAYLETEVGTS